MQVVDSRVQIRSEQVASGALVMGADVPTIQGLKCYASAQQPSPLDMSHHTQLIFSRTQRLVLDQGTPGPGLNTFVCSVDLSSS